jgi:NADP-dependent aldehyde dehydrogenase
VIFGVDAGRRALVDPRIKACGFTGSAAGGRSLFDAASARPDPIPFYGELGSVNPVVVTPGALAARGPEIAEGFLGSFTLGGGQFCTKPGLLFLPAGHGLAAELQRLVGTSAAKAMLNSRIRDGFVTLTGELEATGIVDLIAAGEAAPDEGAWAATRLYVTSAAELLRDPELVTAERFGPSSIVVEYEGVDELEAALGALEGSLAAGIHAEQGEEFPVDRVVDALRRFAGRVLWNGWPTGVAVAWAQHHGGPWPATTSPLHTSVGAAAIRRWLRPLVYQDFPADLLPPALRDENPWNLPRRVDGALHLADR